LCPKRLRFIDETGVNITLTRRYGRAPRGARITESVPKNYRAQRSIISAIQCSAQVLWLAPYSPDFSPLELLWAKIKTGLRQAKARTVEQLSRALTEGLELITTNDCRTWFKHCGYSVSLK
jgi:transposase